tara:strand:- start:3586 stop:3954 length:369 start_codon:yes stop_codon:yes gene_type:complete
MKIEKIYGIYHADGGIIGELSYVWGKITGTAHCSLCDITHKGISMKRDWKNFTNSLDVDFELLHLNEQTQVLADFTAGKTPCVVGEELGEMKILVDAESLEGCNKSVSSFESTLMSSMGLEK